MQRPIPEPMQAKPRWKCPTCNGTKVQVCYRAWYRETADFELHPVDIDTEGDAKYYCDDCGEHIPPEENED